MAKYVDTLKTPHADIPSLFISSSSSKGLHVTATISVFFVPSVLFISWQFFSTYPALYPSFLVHCLQKCLLQMCCVFAYDPKVCYSSSLHCCYKMSFSHIYFKMSSLFISQLVFVIRLHIHISNRFLSNVNRVQL